jgi:hypothetical protein
MTGAKPWLPRVPPLLHSFEEHLPAHGSVSSARACKRSPSATSISGSSSSVAEKPTFKVLSVRTADEEVRAAGNYTRSRNFLEVVGRCITPGPVRRARGVPRVSGGATRQAPRAGRLRSPRRTGG